MAGSMCNTVVAVMLVLLVVIDGVALAYWRPQGRFGKRTDGKDGMEPTESGLFYNCK